MRVLVLLSVLAAIAPATAAAGAPATKTPGELVVALSLPSPAFQVGAVDGSNVVFAKGFEVDLARKLARRLGTRRIRFVQQPVARIVAPGRKSWDVALARLSATPGRARAVDFSVPYLPADQAVLLRRALSRPHDLAALRSLQLCAERGTRSADLIAARIHPAAKAILTSSDDALLRLVQTGLCDAAIDEGPQLGLLTKGQHDRFGPIAGRIDTGGAYAVALEKGSPLRPAVDRALRRLLADGTVHRLAKEWLGLDPARLRILH